MNFTSSEETTITFGKLAEEEVETPVAPAPTNAGPTEKEQELQGDLQRLQAEYVNYRKRVERDRDVSREAAIKSTLTALFPVLDDIDAARQHGDLAEGPFRSIADKLDGILSQLGLVRIDTADVAFDPEIHEAVITQPSDTIKEDNVIQVFRNGYIIGDKTVRAAQVMVSNG